MAPNDEKTLTDNVKWSSLAASCSTRGSCACVRAASVNKKWYGTWLEHTLFVDVTINGVVMANPLRVGHTYTVLLVRLRFFSIVATCLLSLFLADVCNFSL